MKKLVLLMMTVLIVSSFVSAEKVASLPDISKPDSIKVDCNRIVITEGASIYIYSLKDFSLIKKFGKAGEGPQEFKISAYGGSGLMVDVTPQKIQVTSVGKVSSFTLDGEFINELKAPFNFLGNRYLALGSKYVGIGSAVENGQNYLTLEIFDAHLNKIKELHRWLSPYNPTQKGTRMFTDTPVFAVIGDKILASVNNDFKINVFDSNGTKINTISKEYKKIPVSKALQDDVVHFFKSNPATQNIYELYIAPLIFPDSLPAMRFFFAKENKIYVLTFKKKDNLSELCAFNLEGKQLDEFFLPIEMQSPLQYYPLDIKDGLIYQLLEDDESETWELHTTKIK